MPIFAFDSKFADLKEIADLNPELATDLEAKKKK